MQRILSLRALSLRCHRHQFTVKNWINSRKWTVLEIAEDMMQQLIPLAGKGIATMREHQEMLVYTNVN